jgi:hypothetical protein
MPRKPAKPVSARGKRFCQCLANFMRFCQRLANSQNRAAGGFAKHWQNQAVFAKHWQNAERTRRGRVPAFICDIHGAASPEAA